MTIKEIEFTVIVRVDEKTTIKEARSGIEYVLNKYWTRAGILSARVRVPDDTEFIQWLFDNGVPLPAGRYHITRPILVGPVSKED